MDDEKHGVVKDRENTTEDEIVVEEDMDALLDTLAETIVTQCRPLGPSPSFVPDIDLSHNEVLASITMIELCARSADIHFPREILRIFAVHLGGAQWADNEDYVPVVSRRVQMEIIARFDAVKYFDPLTMDDGADMQILVQNNALKCMDVLLRDIHCHSEDRYCYDPFVCQYPCGSYSHTEMIGDACIQCGHSCDDTWCILKNATLTHLAVVCDHADMLELLLCHWSTICHESLSVAIQKRNPKCLRLLGEFFEYDGDDYRAIFEAPNTLELVTSICKIQVYPFANAGCCDISIWAVNRRCIQLVTLVTENGCIKHTDAIAIAIANQDKPIYTYLRQQNYPKSRGAFLNAISSMSNDQELFAELLRDEFPRDDPLVSRYAIVHRNHDLLRTLKQHNFAHYVDAYLLIDDGDLESLQLLHELEYPSTSETVETTICDNKLTNLQFLVGKGFEITHKCVRTTICKNNGKALEILLTRKRAYAFNNLSNIFMYAIARKSCCCINLLGQIIHPKDERYKSECWCTGK